MIYYFGQEIQLPENVKELLPDDRYAKYCRLAREIDKRNCLCAYLLLKFALKKEFGLNEFTLSSSVGGKPYIKETNKIHFNLSHCDSGIAVVVGTEAVGIDIQPVTEVKDAVLNRVFSDDEINAVRSSESPKYEFTRLWTLKESAVKRRGETLADIKKYNFPSSSDRFCKYGDKYSVFSANGALISACSYEFYDKIITVTKEELF
ncbi:MAG: 4'-phosphopantetheinyl transferase superfamily protein [Clostridia bacterium]|nr:4'-phosphopantetheinyl transferase superfamily protein [Clostridia bacterium]